jgi:hypothetical protein
MQAAPEVAVHSSRWVKLTRESALRRKAEGLRKASRTGNPTGVINGKKYGQIGGFLEFAKKPASLLNPAVLGAAGNVMTQLAMQKALADIIAKLSSIEVKVDAIRLDHKIDKMADLTGARMMITRVTGMMDKVYRVTATQWSTVQDIPLTIAKVQASALIQLAAIARSVRGGTTFRALSATAEATERDATYWLAVLEHCWLLWDAVDVLAIDREKHTSPDAVDGYQQSAYKTASVCATSSPTPPSRSARAWRPLPRPPTPQCSCTG